MRNRIGRIFILLLLVFGLTACASNKNNNNNEVIPYEKSNEEISQEINALIDQEGEIIAKNKDAWDKVFAYADKSNAEEANYYKFLSNAFEQAKKDLSEKEIELVGKDLEEIKAIEEKIAEKAKGIKETNEANIDTKEDSNKKEKFPEFTAKDFAGKDLDSSIFKNNAVTILNFWNNGCLPCIEEMPKLNELNKSLKERGGEIIGVNADMINGDEDSLKEAKGILEKQKVEYRNIYFDQSSEAWKPLLQSSVFPTTILVNRKGEVVGDPIAGSIENEKLFDLLNKRIEKIIAEDNK